MRPLTTWFRSHPFAADGLLAAALFALELTGLAGVGEPVVTVALALALATALAWRRRAPLVSAWAIYALLVLGIVADRIVRFSDAPPPGQLFAVVMLYTLVLYRDRRLAALYAAALLVAELASRLVLGTDFVFTAFFLLLYLLAWITAAYLGARRAYITEVSARLAVAEADRDRRAVDAVSAERTRIARELHDVVAHAVSVMIVQADGAGYALRADPDRAEAALRNISATGRSALAELRRTVALLRTDDAGTAHPEYGTAALARVVEMMRAAGLTVSMEMTGDLDAVPPSIALGVHRVVQESLTNALRHGGDRPRAAVVVTRADDAVTVSVTNTPRRPGETPPPDTAVPGVELAGSGSGFGVIGMRERVAVLGGDLQAGSLPAGGWRVRAVLPLDPADTPAQKGLGA